MDDPTKDIVNFFSQPNAYRSVLILFGSIAVTYVLSKFVAEGIIKIAQIISVRSDTESNEEKLVRLRQVETYLSVTVAIVRAAVVLVIGYVIWRLLSPGNGNSTIAAIGASTVFVVVAGQTIAPVLRDLTTGAIMIIEQWFNVGDFIKIEPFGDVSGVVERLTLRSTKLRSLNGEVVWIHNQQIMSVHVTPRGIRTISVDVFAHDKQKGLKTLKQLTKAIPVSPMMIAHPMVIHEQEEWGKDMWRITVTGQTAPGREWLIERFFVNAIEEVDSNIENKADRTFIYAPIARYTDPVAEKRFKRAVRARKNS